MEPVTVTVPDACKAIGIGRTKLYELIDGGKLETVRIGQRRLIKTSSIRRLVGEAA
jgi:excisionase family DNA binding protein